MNNIITYVETVLDGFDVRPFSPVDSLVLSCMAYLHLPEAFSEAYGWEGIPLSSLYRAEHFAQLLSVTFTPERTKKLLTALAANPRFRDARVMGYTSRLNEETQFSAMTFRLTETLSYVAFRGTDTSLAGWKEDFHMAFRFPIPAQEQALQYLEEAAQHCPGEILLGGHSKGGNLAVYAAAFCAPALQNRIGRIYSHDGPGFLPAVLESEGFARIRSRIGKTLPQSSVIGMLLEQQERYQVVQSRSVSLLQHDPFTWRVEKGAFVPVKKLTANACYVDSTLSAWLEQMSVEERERVVDSLFSIFSTNDITDFEQLVTDWQKNLPAVAKTAVRLDSDTREFLGRALKELAVLSVKKAPQLFRRR